MDAAVELDDELGVVAIEVGDVGAELVLATELQSEELTIPE